MYMCPNSSVHNREVPLYVYCIDYCIVIVWYIYFQLRYYLWHMFQSPLPVKLLYDASSILATNIIKDFAEMTFVNVNVADTFKVWK